MKYTLRIPTKEQYAYIEAELGYEEFDTPGMEDAVHAYNELTRLIQGGAGVGIKKLAEIIHEYCKTGNIADGGGYDFSSNESLLVGELKKIIRKNNQ